MGVRPYPRTTTLDSEEEEEVLGVELILSGEVFIVVETGLEDWRERLECKEEEDFGDAGDFDVAGRDDDSREALPGEEVGDASSVTVAGRAVTGPSWATGDVGEAGARGSEGDAVDCPGGGTS